MLARHVGGALAFYRSQLEQGGLPVPDGLDGLIAVAQLVVDSRGQLHPLRRVGLDTGEVSRGYLLRLGDAAEVAGTSVKTLRRRIAEGSLRDVRVGAVQFIDPLELGRFLRSEPAERKPA